MDWKTADKKQLLEKLLPVLEENERFRESITRLLKRQSRPMIYHHLGHEDDFVPVGWVERYGIDIPRADGFFESENAWVRVTHGVITNAGFKNQSILSLLILRGHLDDGAQKHANLYIDWRAAFFARTEAARYSDSGSGDPEAWSKEDRFSKLLKAVERKCLRQVDAIVTSRPKEKDVASLNEDPEGFLASFGKMARAVNQINRAADDYLEAKRSGVTLEDLRVTEASV